MKVRHEILARTALGWYLMVPPVGKTGRLHVSVDAPVSQWRTFKTLDTKEKCEQERAALLQRAQSILREPENRRYADLVEGKVTPQAGHDNDPDILNARGILGALAARCVGSDDPGLTRIAPKQEP